MRIWTDDGQRITLRGSPEWGSRWNCPFVAGEDYRGAKVSVALAHIVRFEEGEDE